MGGKERGAEVSFIQWTGLLPACGLVLASLVLKFDRVERIHFSLTLSLSFTFFKCRILAGEQQKRLCVTCHNEQHGAKK